MSKLTRGEFVRLAVLFIGTGGAIAACGDDDSNGSSPDGGRGDGASNPQDSSTGDSASGTDASDASKDTGTDSTRPPNDSGQDSNLPLKSCTANGASGTVGGGHTHPFANIVATDFAVTTNARTYTLQLASGHTHTLTLEPAELEMLKNGQTVTKASSFDGHDHPVTVTCL